MNVKKQNIPTKNILEDLKDEILEQYLLIILIALSIFTFFFNYCDNDICHYFALRVAVVNSEMKIYSEK